MKTVICTKYGNPDVLQLKEIPKPIPNESEVLIRVIATTVHRGDTRIRSLNVPGPKWQVFLARLFLGFNKPKNSILGMELSGIIENIGENVTKFKIGEEVFASTVWSKYGAYAEYKCMSEDNILLSKPYNLTFEEAATIPSGGITALWIMKKANIQKGQTVLIYGASGSIGTFAVQLAKAFGAEVTAICSTSNAEMVESLGADKVIDYTQANFTDSNETFDVVFDSVDKVPSSEAKKVLKPDGKYLNVHKDSDGAKQNNALSLLNELKIYIEEQKLKAVIDRTYPLDQIVEAHKYVDKGRKKGNVVIVVAEEEPLESRKQNVVNSLD